MNYDPCFPPFLMTLPPDELSELKASVRTEVQQWAGILRQVYAALALGEGKVNALRRIARESHVAVGTLTTKYYAVEAKGWQALINRAKNPLDRMDGLPLPFLTHWRGLMESHQRDTSGREARRALVRQWREWHKGDLTSAIPGYNMPPPPEKFTGVPKGWSHPNLMRHAPTRYERKIRRQGTMAAKELLPSVRTTRVGVPWWSHIVCDDQWHDTYINVPGINRKMTRPLSFNALELHSGCDFTRGYKPILLDDEGKRSMLTEADFFWFILHILSEFGYRNDDIGTCFVIEHGTAGMCDALKQAFSDLTGGKVTFSTGGILGDPLMKSMIFRGQSRGNFKFKAARESWFNLFRNCMAGLPAATGRNTQMAPEESHGLSQYNSRLLKAAEKLTPERRALLAFPVLEWSKYTALADQIAELINRRGEEPEIWTHELEGWEELGYLTREIRLHSGDNEWKGIREILAVEDPDMQALALRCMAKEGLSRGRRLSPREVFESHHAQTPLKKVSPFHWHLLIPNECAVECRVSEKHEIVIKDTRISPAPLVYTSEVFNQQRRRWALSTGERVRVYVNPYRPEAALVCELNDSAIGLVQLLDRPSRADLPGMAEVYGKVRSVQGILERDTKRRAAAMTEDRQEMAAHNRRVIAGKAVTPTEYESAARFEEASTHWDDSTPLIDNTVEEIVTTDPGF